MKLKYINNENKFNNVKQIAKEYFHMSDRLILKLKNKQLIFINSKISKITDKLEINDIIEFDLGFDEISDNIVANNIKLNIIYEDDSLLILNKPANMPIHPSANHYLDSLSNGVKYYYNLIKLSKKIRPVNRLDKDTTGLVIFAKNEYIQEALIYQMKVNQFKKKYLALLDGYLENKDGIINAPIARKPDSIMEREINFETGQNAISKYKVIKEFKIQKNQYSLVEFELLTGRTHQIRVHSKFIGHPIVGDTLYGSSSSIIDRQALHSYFVSFIHPITKKQLELTCPWDKNEIRINNIKKANET